MYDETVRLNIHVDVLVNNAGFALGGTVLEYDEETALSMMMLHMVNLFLLTRYFATDMITRGWGRIVNTASVAGFCPVPKNVLYSATKAFIIFLSMGMSYELKGTGVVCMALCPGATESDMMARANLQTRIFTVFKKFLVQHPDKVAATCINGIRSGAFLAVSGMNNRFLVFLTRILSRTCGMRIGEYFLANTK